jgi:hypothetical protein
VVYDGKLLKDLDEEDVKIWSFGPSNRWEARGKVDILATPHPYFVPESRPIGPGKGPMLCMSSMVRELYSLAIGYGMGLLKKWTADDESVASRQ